LLPNKINIDEKYNQEKKKGKTRRQTPGYFSQEEDESCPTNTRFLKRALKG
jgi:hypothetical protein